MNAEALIRATLLRLDRPTDSATVEIYQDRLLGYLNEGIMDMVLEVRPWRRDELPVHEGKAELNDLPRTCLKALSARIDGKRQVFYYGSSRGSIHFPGVGEATAEITYRFMPEKLTALTDEPELPEACLELLVQYATARERSRFDAVSQNAARLEMSLYREEKGKLRRMIPPPELPQINNIY